MDNKKAQQEFIEQLQELVAELGWVIGVPEGDGTVDGLIIGKMEFVETIVEAAFGPGFSTFEEDATGEVIERPPSKKTTLH